MHRALSVLAACCLFLSASPIAHASVVSVETLWNSSHRAAMIVVVEVETVDLVYPPDVKGADGELRSSTESARVKVLLRVREVWKGTAGQTISLDLPAYVYDADVFDMWGGRASRPRRTPDTVVVFFEPADRPAIGDVGRLLRPRPGDLELLRGVVKEAVAVQAGRPFDALDPSPPDASFGAPYRAWRLLGLAHRATRTMLIAEDFGGFSPALLEYDRSDEWTREEQKVAAEGFVREPSLDEGLAKVLFYLRRHKSRALDETALGCVENTLSEPGTLPEGALMAMALVLERYGASKEVRADLESTLSPVEVEEVRPFWERAAREARLPPVPARVRERLAELREQTPQDR